VVITEKGLSDLAAHFLSKAGVSAIRRLRKTDANRVARACGATIVHRPDEIRDSDIGTVREERREGAGLGVGGVCAFVLSGKKRTLPSSLSLPPVSLLSPEKKNTKTHKKTTTTTPSIHPQQ
jgi:chaperonin GroEL (HSP60 family)